MTVTLVPKPRMLGKKPAVQDDRLPMLAKHLRWSNLPEPPPRLTWLAELPRSGVPLLGNDRYGCCVEASVLHYLQLINLYLTSHGSGVGQLHTPSVDECLAIYSAVTGFKQDDPSTDQGTSFLGKGGMLEYWMTHGVIAGGVLNKATAAAVVNAKDPREIRKAVQLFGFVFTGANLTQDNVQSDFMWLPGGPTVGGHEFGICGYGPGYYEVETWDGVWRCTPEWVEKQVDEMCVVVNPGFFNKAGVDPANVDLAELTADQRMLA